MSEPGPRTVRHEHGGVEWDVPVDLLEIQRRFDAANADCTRLAESHERDAYHAAQQRRMAEVAALHEHPWLRQQMAQGRRHQADTALKHLARSTQS
jgi:hypothetical protein